MDTGSQRTYITEEIVKKLKLTTEGNVKLTVFTFGASRPKEITTLIVTVLLKSQKGNTVSIKASVVPEISGNVQRAPIKIDNQFKIIRKYELADTLPKHTESSSVGILIGNDYYNGIISTERIKMHEGLYIIKSKFGWMINGRTKTKEGSKDENVMLVMTHSINNIFPEIHQFTLAEPSLQPAPDIDEFWELEAIGIIPPDKTKYDDGVMEHFNNTVIEENGRYQVACPWRNEDVNLPENYGLSYGRLRSLHKRIVEVPDMLYQYENIIKDQHEKGIIEKVDEKSKEGERKHYIPHHAVFTPAKNTTKVRIVYDASAKTKKTNLSLNECLYRGPVIPEDLCGL